MEETNKEKNWVIPASIVLAGVLVAGAIIYSRGADKRGGVPLAGGDKAGGQAALGSGVTAAFEESDPSLGDPGAAVSVVEFSDFQCPFCGKFFHESEQKIIDKYVKTGKVRFVYRDFAFLGPESEYAAVAAECANEQGKFWEYHNYLFNNQSGENQGAFSKDKLKSFAKTLGLSAPQFDSCLDADKYLDEVKKDSADGRASGVTGTPGFLINGKLVVGALPYEQFESEIEAALIAPK